MNSVATRRTLEKKLRRLTRASESSIFAHLDNENCVQLLCFCGGFIDAFGYLEVNGLFTSSITGNIVVAAAAIVSLEGVLSRALVSTVFTIASGVGAFVAVRLRASHNSFSAPCIISLILFGLELICIVASMIYGLHFRPLIDAIDDPNQSTITFAASILAASMGFQSIAVRESITDAPSTTVMTSCLVTVAQNCSYTFSYFLASRDCCYLLPQPLQTGPVRDELLQHNFNMWALKLSVAAKPLVCFVIGCVIGALLGFYVSFWALVVPLLLVGLVMAEISLQYVMLRGVEQQQQRQRQRQRCVGYDDDDDVDSNSTIDVDGGGGGREGRFTSYAHHDDDDDDDDGDWAPRSITSVTKANLIRSRAGAAAAERKDAGEADEEDGARGRRVQVQIDRDVESAGNYNNNYVEETFEKMY